jgi:predicted nucleic-acid-binding protein
MSSNVLALEPVRNLHHDGKPNRAEVEAAVRTIIRAFAVIVRNDKVRRSRANVG